METARSTLAMRHLLAIAIAVGVLPGCGQSNSAVSQSSKESNLRAAESFVDTFYAFESDALDAMLARAADSIPSIGFYQGWAEGGNYQIVNRMPCVAKEPELVSCSITVRDDLMLALGIDFNVTDTFEISYSDGEIDSVEISSNDLQVYWDAREWVNEKYPELTRIPCQGMFDGGPTPGECVRTMVEGYARFAASDDFPEAQALLRSGQAR